MPAGNPLIGEVWSSTSSTIDGTSRAVRGVVAEVVSNVITLVSFTGNRLRVSPDRFQATWQFVQARPSTHRRCQSCDQQAVFSVGFDQEPVPSYFCPRHTPTGIQAVLLPNSSRSELLESLQGYAALQEDGPRVLMASTDASRQEAIHCPLCSRDRLVQVVTFRVTGGTAYHCEGCNQRMVHANLSGQSLSMFIPNLARDLERNNCPLIEIQMSHGAYAELLRNHSTSVGFPVATSPDAPVNLYGFPMRTNPGIPGQGAFFVHRNPDHLRTGDPGRPAPTLQPTPPELQVPPEVGSGWVTRAGGSVVTVERVTSQAVHFRASGSESNAVMTLPDFLTYHRKAEHRPNKKAEPIPHDIKVGEEWEQRSGLYAQAVKIIEINDRLQAVVVEEPDGTRKSLRLVEIVRDWKRVTRVTLYDRLNREDDF